MALQTNRCSDASSEQSKWFDLQQENQRSKVGSEGWKTTNNKQYQPSTVGGKVGKQQRKLTLFFSKYTRLLRILSNIQTSDLALPSGLVIRLLVAVVLRLRSAS